MIFYDESLEYPVPPSPTWHIQDGSKIGTYMRCPRMYFFEYVLGWRSIRPSNHLAFGTAMHKALEHMYLTDFSIPNLRIAAETFVAEYRKVIDPGEDDLYHPKTPERAVKALAYYASYYRDDPRIYRLMEHGGKKLVEIGGTVSISDVYEVAFRMDTVMEEISSGMIFSMDHKAKAPPWNWPVELAMSPQTVIYTHVLYCMYPPERVAGMKYNGLFFKRTKDDAKRDAADPMRHFEFLRVPVYKPLEMMASLISEINFCLDFIRYDFNRLACCSPSDASLGAFARRPIACTDFGGCGFFDYCNNWPNPLSRVDRLPMDMKIEFWNPLAEEVNVKLDIRKEDSHDRM